ncbi:MAG TPA: 2Fe-2S iron-sulfur cluster-binding protein [Rhodoferax sp.]|nr:2Fe-2S iron-sulfur cluster-binding protein [Rhodoferax sp.]
MTATLLLANILAAMLLQLLVLAGVAMWRRASSTPATGSPVPGDPVAATRSLAWSGTRDFRVVRREYEDPAGSQCSFYLTPVDGAELPPFKPGQFLTFQLQPTVADDVPQRQRPITRCYSLSDQPDPRHYRITIKRVPPPASQPGLPAGLSSNHCHDHVQVGDVLQVKAPSGHFHLDVASLAPVVLVGGGIGITPMMSMLRWCQAEQPGRTVHLFYGLRNSAEHAFKQTLEQLASTHSQVHLNVVYSQPGPDDVLGRDYQHTGHITVALLRQQLPLGAYQFYVCGPAPMMEALVPELLAWGVPQQDVHFEAFGPASVRLPVASMPPAAILTSTPLEVRFARSGRTLPWDGQQSNLLDFAERHGVAVDSGCRSGGCGSCETRLRKGTVSYASAPDHDPAPGHCLLCVATPTSDLELEA